MKNVSIEKIKMCKKIAILGIILMGIASFMACLADEKSISNIGSLLLVLSVIITSYGFTYWRP